jgi:hypothetical protein
MFKIKKLYTRNSTYTSKGTKEKFLFSSGKTITKSSDRNFLYEKEDHLGNVMVVVSDRKVAVEDPLNPGTISHYVADVVFAADYYPMGGMLMPGRNFNANSYRYKYQGQESDDEIYGVVGGAYAFKFRMSNARIGGDFWSIDPLAPDYPGWSPYAFSQRRPIDGIELEGLEWEATKDKDGNVTSANYVGYDENGNAPAGTVPSVAFKGTQDGKDFLQVGMPNGTINSYMPNESGMVQLPKDNNSPNSQFTLTNGNILYNTYSQSGNDNYGPLAGVAGLYNAAVDYQQQYPGERIAIGDMNSPNKSPISLGGGKSHHGNTFQVDIRFLSTNGGSQQGNYLTMKFDPLRSKNFFDIMYQNGFSKVLIHKVPAGTIGGSKMGIVPREDHADHYHFQGFRGR